MRAIACPSFIASVSMVCTASALAGFNAPLAVNPNAADLVGFTDVFGGNSALSARGTCFGCFSLVDVPTTATRGFASITFEGGLWQGRRDLYFAMSFDLPSDPNALSNLQGSLQDEGVQAYGTSYNPYGNCAFSGFLPPSDFSSATSLVMRFDVPQTFQLTADETFVFAWDFTNAAWGGVTPTSIAFVPVPGSAALLALAGVAGRRRRA
jgi:hypothetical protein